MKYPKSVLALVTAFGTKEIMQELVKSMNEPLTILFKDFDEYLEFSHLVAIPNGWVWADWEPFKYDESGDPWLTPEQNPNGMFIELESGYAEGIGWVHGELQQLEYSFMQEYDNNITGKSVLEAFSEMLGIGGQY